MGIVNVGSILWDTAFALRSDEAIPWDAYRNKRILITGATGLIGSQVVRSLLSVSKENKLGITLILPVRNIEKARKLFGSHDNVIIYKWSLDDSLRREQHADFIIHAAAGTSSKDFSMKPVETSSSIVRGTYNVWDYSRSCESQRSLYLSSMEVYGETRVKPISEKDLGFLDPLVPRNGYPQAKLTSENLVASFSSEYGVSSSVLRLTQTFGQGVRTDDGRVFAEFGRSVLKGDNIVLLSDGSKRNSYLSVTDAVRSILIALVRGEDCKAYNVANDDTYCSVLEMAELVLREFGKANQCVTFGQDIERAKSFRHGSDILLDTSALRKLGWSPKETLSDMYRLMFKAWE